LGKGAVRPDDDVFLDLGASSLQAAAAVAKMERVFERSLSLAILMRCRTPRALAEHIQDQSETASRSSLVLVQPGIAARTPLFFAHGDIYGGGLYCPRLAKLVDPDRQFYALTPLGFDRWPPPRSIEGMARRFVREIRSVQHQGPYLLGGFCNGGVVAF